MSTYLCEQGFSTVPPTNLKNFKEAEKINAECGLILKVITLKTRNIN